MFKMGIAALGRVYRIRGLPQGKKRKCGQKQVFCFCLLDFGGKMNLEILMQSRRNLYLNADCTDYMANFNEKKREKKNRC